MQQMFNQSNKKSMDFKRFSELPGIIKTSYNIAILLTLIILLSGCTNSNNADTSTRQKINFDFDWKFTRGDNADASKIVFGDNEWQLLDIPHDWSINDEFDKNNPTGKSGGFASGGIGWYRKNFTLPWSDKSKKVTIEFGGVYMNSEVWINGNYLGKRPYGYISFNYDLTPYLNFDGDNIIAVRVDNSQQPNARW